MDAKEFEIKKFETNHPDLVVLIDVWAQHSIKQDWDALCVVLNHHTVPDCPESVWCDTLKANKRYYFFMKLSEKVADYLMAKGYKMTSRTYGEMLISPDGRFMQGDVVRGYTKVIKK